jgi:shikimate kinase
MTIRDNDKPTLDRHVVIIGMMGAGKTTLGRALARRLGVPYEDSDDAIHARYGRPGRDLAEAHGVSWLHHLEAETLLHQLEATEPAVISAAASTVDSPECVAAMTRMAHVCWVRVPMEELMVRVLAGEHRRPMDVAELNQRWERRKPIFEELADCWTEGTGPIGEQVNAVVDALSREGRGS